MKACTKCGAVKPLDAFYADARRDDGHRPACSACMRARQSLLPQKNRDPAKKADYRRRTGVVSCDYVPAEERSRRRSAWLADQCSHVRVWRHHLAAKERRSLHDAHVRDRQSPRVRWALRYKADPEFNVQQRLRTQLRKKAKAFPKLGDLMRDALNRGGASNVVLRACGFNIAELRAHLEALFTDGMNWEAFTRGEIHIDHRTPQAAFDLNDEAQVRACWALANLQPLWARDNLTKGDSMPMHQAGAGRPPRARNARST